MAGADSQRWPAASLPVAPVSQSGKLSLTAAKESDCIEIMISLPATIRSMYHIQVHISSLCLMQHLIKLDCTNYFTPKQLIFLLGFLDTH